MSFVPVVFICDNSFVMQTAVAITSLLHNKSKDTFYEINVIVSNVSQENVKSLRSMNSDGCKINVIEADAKNINGLHKSKSGKYLSATSAALFKFELPQLLPELEKVIYLDGDVIVRGDLKELFDIELDDNFVAAAHDTGKLYLEQKYNLKFPDYFNSGVMVLNLAKMRAENTAEKLKAAKRAENDQNLMDQNILNIVFSGKVKIIDIKWNFLCLNLLRARGRYTIEQINELFNSDYQSFRDIEDKAVIYHYSSKDKPWKFPNIPYSDLWFKYYNISPIKDVKLAKIRMNTVSGGGLNALVIISLTSFPARIKTVHQTIETLINQTYKPDKIILQLSEDEFPNKEDDLPENLLKLKKRGLIINWNKGNIKSYNKFIPTLKQYPNDIIITADDDILYYNDWLEKLVSAYHKNPDYIHCHRAHLILFDHKRKILPYNKWKQSISYVKQSYNNFFTGIGGVLYPPNSLHPDIFNEQKFEELAPHADDIWFWAMAVLNGTEINVIRDNYKFFKYVDGTQECGLYHMNVEGSKNDEQLANVLKEYPQIMTQLKKITAIDAGLQRLIKRIFSVSVENKFCKTYLVIYILCVGFKFKIRKNSVNLYL